MTSSQFLCFNNYVVPHKTLKFIFQRELLHSLGRQRGLCITASRSYRHSALALLRGSHLRALRNGSPCRKIVRSQLNSFSRRDHMRHIENHPIGKRFSLRIRPRLWLFMVKLRRAWKNLKRRPTGETIERIRLWLQKNFRRFVVSTFFPIVLGLCYLFFKSTAVSSPKLVPYSDLITSLQRGTVVKVQFEEGSRRIFYDTVSKEAEFSMSKEDNSGSYEALAEKPSDAIVRAVAPGSRSVRDENILRRSSKNNALRSTWQFCTRKVDHDENFLLTLMRDKETSYCSAPQSVATSVRSVLFTVLTLWIPLTPLMWLLYRQLSSANSPAKKHPSSIKRVGFEDVEGVDAAKTELMEIVSCLRGVINYSKLGAKLPRGVLLVGPPGTGKTLLARAVAGEARVPFFTVSASEFVELFVGRGAARIRDLFKVARKYAPSIIFIDELDAVGGKRGRSFNDERDQTLNQLLTEMDGFESEMKVIVIAATNRPEALDPALCRPGRFSRKVFVGEPDQDGRRKILAVHFRGIPLEEDQDLICNLVASLTPGLVGADLANIVNEAALLAARRGAESVSRDDIVTAIERTKFGINENQITSNFIKKELGKLFSWMPFSVADNEKSVDNWQGPGGYQTLS